MIKPKRNKYGELIFEDYPDFRPNLTPYEVFKLGSFGSTYYREIYSSVTGKWYKNADLEFDWKDIPRDKLIKPWSEYDKNSSKYKVKVGTTLEFWESNGWIHPQDPYGFVQWFCRFYAGRRTDDDKRQVKRWLNTAGPNSRFRKRLINMIKQKKTTYNDYSVSPAIRQTLQHWCFAITEYDLI
jgi:hypothetical protein